MTTARCQQVCLDVTPWYHCTTRCVRQAFICGIDALTQRDYSHRRVWIEERILQLAQVFCIDVGAYAVLSNHYHVVIKIDCEAASALSDHEVVERWLSLYLGNEIAQRFNSGETLSTSEKASLSLDINKWRGELANISRFMAEINQYTARRANREDKCKGRFWEARFDSQAILDLDALLRTLVYVDLNPVRAKIAKTPEESKHTSIFRRLTKPSEALTPFASTTTAHPNQREKCLPISFEDYLSLLDWTGKQIHPSKRGSISTSAPPIFQRLNYSRDQWFDSLQPSITWKQKAIGSAHCVVEYCQTLGQRWIWQSSEHKIGV